MIPKALNEIEWADLEAFKASGREEGDTIEFKASFSGGADYIGMTDSQREKAIKGIAREAIAFLNGRGGDIIVGAEEVGNDHPRIEAFRNLKNVSATADRLAQALAATIEPYQAVLGVRAIRPGAEDTGVIVVRAPASLRAPHRFTRDRECYIRRGRESVPMPMDEIQDLTLYRSMARSERKDLLDRQFADLSETRFGNILLAPIRTHLRVCFVPDQIVQVDLSREDLSAFFADDPLLRSGEKTLRNNVAFSQLNAVWRPQLRGRVAVGHHDYGDEFQFCLKSIKKSLILACDFAIRHTYEVRGANQLIVNYDWILGFLANAFHSMKGVLKRHELHAAGMLRFGIYSSGLQKLVTGERVWAQVYDFPEGVTFAPDFEVNGVGDLDSIFEQVQSDVCAIAGAESHATYSFTNE